MRALRFERGSRIESDHPRAVRGVVRFACGACGNHSAQVQNKTTAIHEEGAPRNSRAFLIVFLAFLSAFGPLAASLAVFSLATAGAVFAPDIETFIAMRFLEGLGASGAVVMYRSIAADLHAGRELATLMAVVGAIQGIAPVTAPMIGALIAEAAGWREIFMLLLAIGVSLTALRR